jgi:hypothetical protein
MAGASVCAGWAGADNFGIELCSGVAAGAQADSKITNNVIKML